MFGGGPGGHLPLRTSPVNAAIGFPSRADTPGPRRQPTRAPSRLTIPPTARQFANGRAHRSTPVASIATANRPAGFALEHYDLLGRRDTYRNGDTIDDAITFGRSAHRRHEGLRLICKNHQDQFYRTLINCWPIHSAAAN